MKNYKVLFFLFTFVEITLFSSEKLITSADWVDMAHVLPALGSLDEESMEEEVEINHTNEELGVEINRCVRGPYKEEEIVLRPKYRRVSSQNNLTIVMIAKIVQAQKRNKDLSCPVKTCGRKFLKYRSLKEHLYRHAGKRPFQCSQCGRSFAGHTGLINHKKVHINNLPYGCFCGKRFRNSYNLTQHQLTHESNKSLACENCDKVFKYPIYLKRHSLKVHLALK